MMESKGTWMAVVMIIGIIGNAVSYVAVDAILGRVLDTPTRIVVTVSNNEVESVAELPEIPLAESVVVEIPTFEKQTENEPILGEFHVGGKLTPQAGVFWFGEQKETYYNLPMDVVVMYAKQRIDGMEDAEYWIRSDGAKMLGDYVMCAVNYDVHPYGSLLETSLGTGIAVDTGLFATYSPKQVDLAVNW